MKRKIDVLVVILIAGATLLFTSLALHDDRADALSRYQAGKQLRIGYALEAPLVQWDPRGGVTGTEPEVLRRALQAIGPGRTVWIYAEFDSLIHELRAGRIDIIAAGLEITAERRQLVAFSKPTMRVRTGLLVASGNPLGLDSLTAVARHGRAKIAVLSGSVEAGMARRAGVPEARLVALPDLQSVHAAMTSGRADAFALSTLSLRALESRGGTVALEVVDLPDYESGWRSGKFAFAFRHKDVDLRDAVDRALDGLLGSDAHRELLASFGVRDDNPLSVVALP